MATNQQILKMISIVWNGANVTNLFIDNEFGCVTATINGIKNIDCGFIEDYDFGGNYYHNV